MKTSTWIRKVSAPKKSNPAASDRGAFPVRIEIHIVYGWSISSATARKALVPDEPVPGFGVVLVDKGRVALVGEIVASVSLGRDPVAIPMRGPDDERRVLDAAAKTGMARLLKDAGPPKLLAVVDAGPLPDVVAG
jgi:hypothetical protein